MEYFQSLHNHTTNSDGDMSPFELLAVAKKLGFSHMAITDHDSVLTKQDVEQLRSNQQPTEWISGIEITSGLPLELGGGVASNFHIIGLFVDPFDKNLIEYCKNAQGARIERAEKMASNLRDVSFNITIDDILKNAKDSIIGRPHIVKALLLKPENSYRLYQIELEMAKDAECNSAIMNKYVEVMFSNAEQLVYNLLLGDDAYLKGVYVDHLHLQDMDQSVKLIHDAGGLAFQAHWHLSRKIFNAQMLKKMLVEKRLDGAETVWHTTKQKEEENGNLKSVENIVEKCSALKSGGADTHTRANLEAFAKNKWLANKTIGLTQKILEEAQVDTTWSSL
jgi:predicted metal-dependent phosphoesterase TrpH